MRKFLLTLVAMLALTGFNRVSAAPHAGHTVAHAAVHATGHAAVAHHAPAHVVVNHAPAHVAVRTTTHVANAAYHVTHAVHFAHGYYYRGRDHAHWAFHRWDARYGCEVYWDPGLLCWFYWCQPANCYYPVSYCPYNTYVWTTPVLVQPVAVPVAPTTSCPPIPAPLVSLSVR